MDEFEEAAKVASFISLLLIFLFFNLGIIFSSFESKFQDSYSESGTFFLIGILYIPYQLGINIFPIVVKLQNFITEAPVNHGSMITTFIEGFILVLLKL